MFGLVTSVVLECQQARSRASDVRWYSIWITGNDLRSSSKMEEIQGEEESFETPEVG